MEPELSLTEQVVSALKNIPNIPGDLDNSRPATQAIKQTKKILQDFEESRMPYPTIMVTRQGIRLIWSSYARELRLLVDQTGEMSFESILRSYDKDGQPAAALSSEGPIEGKRGIAYMMAWYLSDVTAEA